MKDAAAGWGTEKWIENQLAANPALFEPHGLELDLCSQSTGVGTAGGPI